jgi:hypothetical protein
MIKLTQVKINKYKSIQKSQTVNIDPSITTIVGMNEAGKTSFLTAIAKTNYFTNDPDFLFDLTQDYPRNELIDFQHQEEDCDIIQCTYEISDDLIKKIEVEFGKGVFLTKVFTYTCHYISKVSTLGGINVSLQKYLEHIVTKYELSEATKETIKKTASLMDIATIVAAEGDVDLPAFHAEIKRIIEGGFNIESWSNHLESYIAKNWVKAKMPKFWYFDDYYPLRGKVNINKLISEPPTKEKDKTSKALFELARIKPEEILNATEKEYEKYIALLEASSNKITNRHYTE